MSATHRSLRWRTFRVDGDGRTETIGLEHVEVKIAESGVTAEGVSVAGDGETAFAARWRMTVDPEWACVRSLHLTRLGGATLALRHDGYGGWSDGEGKPRKDFAGLTDCLVENSPFGLTALVARLGKKAAKAQSVEAVVVGLPSLEAAKRTVALKPLDGAKKIAVTIGETTFDVDFDDTGTPTRFGETIALV
ncbi:MAG: putative glycolipid-binding domain-containing protein [Phyllobacteriaceae bacterium]|nr:putative glycolipid-binding domain-containing protein [Phyllobacteriaceae bacterium]